MLEDRGGLLLYANMGIDRGGLLLCVNMGKIGVTSLYLDPAVL